MLETLACGGNIALQQIPFADIEIRLALLILVSGGRIQLPPNLVERFGCGRVTLKSVGRISTPPVLDDFRCYDPAIDAYNFQAHGPLELTPQERSSAFVVGNYKLSENVSTYLELVHNKTQSAAQFAPQPVDTDGTPLLIKQRRDLAGLPLRQGEECKLKPPCPRFRLTSLESLLSPVLF